MWSWLAFVYELYLSNDEWWTSWVYIAGSFVTHETNHFIYFYLDTKAVLLFKSGWAVLVLQHDDWYCAMFYLCMYWLITTRAQNIRDTLLVLSCILILTYMVFQFHLEFSPSFSNTASWRYCFCILKLDIK